MHTPLEFVINGRKIGDDNPPYIICELSGNHNGSLEKALNLVDEAAKTGCDAIKLQTYTPDTLTINCDNKYFQISQGLWSGNTLYELYRMAHTPFEWHEPLFRRANELNVTMFSSPFDETAVDLLEEIGVPAYKIASFEIADVNLIKYIARTGKPIIMSTGLATDSDIERAIKVAREAGCKHLALLHCVSSYPTPVDQANVRSLLRLKNKYKVITGLSDHTLSNATSVAAVSIGAAIIEKHFTISRSDGGPDADFSLEPVEFKNLTNDCYDAWSALGDSMAGIQPAETKNVVFRRSLFIVKDIKKGEIFTKENVRCIRPGYGLSPHLLEEIIGLSANFSAKRGTPLSREIVSISSNQENTVPNNEKN